MAHCDWFVLFSIGISQKPSRVIIAMRELPQRRGQSVSGAPGSVYLMISPELFTGPFNRTPGKCSMRMIAIQKT